jgi:hypothetical protein
MIGDAETTGLFHFDLQRSLRFRLRFISVRVLDRLLYLLLVAFLTLIYSPVALLPPYLPEVGEVATRNVKAEREILIEDKDSTFQRRELAAQAVPPVYDWDLGMMEPILSHLREELAWLKENRGDLGRVSVPVPFDSFAEQVAQVLPERTGDPRETLRNAFSERLAERVPAGALDELLRMTEYDTLLKSVEQWLVPLGQRKVVANADVLKDLERAVYTIQFLGKNSEKRATGTADLIDLDSLRHQLGETASLHLAAITRSLRDWLLAETRAMVRPNLVLNLSETQLRRGKAHESVEAVYFHARRGEMVVREGEMVNEATRLKIEALNRSNRTGVTIFRLVGLATSLGLVLWMGRIFLIRTSRGFPRDKRTLHIAGAILLVVALLTPLVYSVGLGMAELFHWPVGMVMYLPPVALGSALISMIIGARHSLPGGSLVTGTVLSFLAAMMVNGGLPLFLYYLIGSLAGGFSLRTCRRRFDVLIAGTWIGLFQMSAVPAVESLAGNLPSLEWLTGAGMAFTSGLLAGLLGLALIPLLESMFNLTTDSRLLELASGDHPLLKELSLRAPGTYHHSVMMSNLAEAAAEAIGANPLMARVMALYHDIGKMTKPQYFVENQSGENRHDQLSPAMSAKVIVGHVKDGEELANRYKLGHPVLAAITEHQGNGLLQYFYNKALNRAAKRGEYVEEAEYRYPGPKPQSKESGILMVADSVEAAARTLKQPSPAQIQALVRRIIAGKIRDGQMDECDLTLKDLSKIEEAFTRVLTLGFYHHRIEYPDQIKAIRPRGTPQAAAS